MRAHLLSRLQTFLDRELRKGLKVLDIGTGYGSSAAFLSEKLPNSTRLWTLDPSQEVLHQAEERFKAEGIGPNVSFVKGTIEKLPFEDNFFDLIASLAVLHHLEGLQSGVKELRRVIKPKTGRLLLVDFAPEAHVLGFRSRHTKDDFFKAEQVTSMLTKEGFSFPFLKHFQYWYIIEAEVR